MDILPLLQEIAELEHKNFALEQENAVKSELKQVLDSWVRYEQQQRESEQLDLVKTVKAGVEAELAKPAFRKQLLEEALAHVEGESTGGMSLSAIHDHKLTGTSYTSFRFGQGQDHLSGWW